MSMIQQLTSVLKILKNGENSKTEKICFVIPTHPVQAPIHYYSSHIDTVGIFNIVSADVFIWC